MALEIVNTVNGIADVLVPPITRKAHYFFCFNDAVEELRDKRNTLICGDSRWIEEVDEVLAQVDENKASVHGWRLNCKLRYRLSKRVAKLISRISKIIATGDMHNYVPGMNSYSSENFVPFECTKKAFNEILEALNNVEVFRIGLCGMGGCGKTLLVKQVGIEAEKLGMKVVFVVVSNRYKLDKESVQNQMAESLNFPLTENCTTVRAQKLLGRLSAGKKTLLILDDVWAALDFDIIGIPEGCKVLITTRSLDVSNAMKCQRNISLGLLTDEEALTLFGKHAATTDDDTHDLAQKIVIECKGLPIAIVAIASILNEKHPDDWRLALKNLQNHEPINIPEGLKDHFTCLRISYELLNDEQAKNVFMLCALYPDDSEISLTILTRFAFGLDLCGDNLYDLCRMKVGSAIRKLINSSLLQDAKGQYVKLHDMVHDVALLIAKEEAQETVVTGKDLNELQKDVPTKNVRRLYFHKINEFPDWLDCPELEILFVDWDGNNSPEVADAFFERTKKLKVFSVIDRSKSLWHTSTLLRSQSTHLNNLRTLRLEGCILDNVSFLASLSSLATLELRDCRITELPNEISELRYLRSLDVSHCRIEGERNPYEVVGGCSLLEELHFLANDISKSVLEDNLIGYLQNLQLEMYHLQIGSCIEHLVDDLNLTTTFLSICQKVLDASTLNARIKKLVQDAQVFLLNQIQQGCKTIIPDMVQDEEGMNRLIVLVLLDSGAIECLIDSTSISRAFSKLAKIRIENMKDLMALIRGHPPTGFLEKLEELLIRNCSQLQNMLFPPNLNLCTMKILMLENCPKLTSLFTPSVAQSLILLAELKITECDELTQIISDEQETRLEDKEQKSYFKQLKALVITRCKQLKWLIPVSFAVNLLKLERLEIIDAPQLTYAFGPDNESRSHKRITKKENKPQIIELPLLKVLQLVKLPVATGIYPEKYHPRWATSAEVFASECPRLSISCLDHAHKQKHTPNYRCLWRGFDWIVPYHIRRQAAKREKDEISHCKQMARQDSLPGTNQHPCGNFIYFNSRISIYETLLENLQDEDVSKIGLYGMGGCGKTTLAKKVAKDVEFLFNKVVFVAVPKDLNVRKIQGRIASALDLKLKEEEEEEESARAQRLHKRLMVRERILLVLDDVWGKLDLKTIGIPSRYDHKGCVVLLTARTRDVCTLMNCETTIHLDLLAEVEAWVLFQNHVGFTDDISDTLKRLARESLHKFAGLPLLIVATASTLKGRPKSLWAKTLKRMHGVIEEDLGRRIYRILRLSFDNLEDEESRELLFLCCLFDEDSEIPVESLIRYGIALGLFGDEGSYERARVRALATIKKLIDSTLLFQGEEECFVTMHDLTRDNLMKMANKEILLADMSQMHQMQLQDTRFLRCSNNIEFPAQLDCPRLEIMIVRGEVENSVDELPDPFVAGRKEPRVLVLVNEGLSLRQMPLSIKCLTHLRCLHLEGWVFGEISIICNLENLDSLTLWNCSFHRLPNEIPFKQKKLRLLDLSRCKIKKNPWQVIGNYSELEELYFFRNCGEWESDHHQNTANLFGVTSRLKRYHIDTGVFRVSESADQCLPTGLHIPNFNAALILTSAIKKVMGRVKVASLGRIWRVGKSFIPDIAQTVNELNELQLSESEGMECLIDSTNPVSHGATVLNKLIKLSLERMWDMKVIYYGPLAPGLFERLEELYITDCLKLQGILFVGKLNLRSLKLLTLDNCPELTSLFEEDEENQNVSSPHSPQVCFPELTALVLRNCHQLKHLFCFCSCHEFPQLEHLFIKAAPQLEEVFGVRRGEITEDADVRVPNLKYVVLWGMPKCASVCRGFDSHVMNSSAYLTVCYCLDPSLDSTISPEGLQRLYRDEVKGASWDSVLPAATIQTILEELEILKQPWRFEPQWREQLRNEQTRTKGRAPDSPEVISISEITEHVSTSMPEQKTASPSSQANTDQSKPQDKVEWKQDSNIQDQTIVSSNLTENFQETMEPIIVEGSKPHKDIIRTLSTHSEAAIPSPGLLTIHPQSDSPQIIQESIHESPSSEKINNMTSSIYLEPRTSLSSSSVNSMQELEDQKSVNETKLQQHQATGDPITAIEVPQKSNIPYDDVLGSKASMNEQTPSNGHAPDSQMSVEESTTSEEDVKEISSTHIEQGSSPPVSLVTSFEKMSPQDFMEKDKVSEFISLEEHTHEENRCTNETPQRNEDASDLAKSVKNLPIETASKAAVTVEVSSLDKPSPLIFSEPVPSSSQANNDQSMPQDKVGLKQDSHIQYQTIGSPNLTERLIESVQEGLQPLEAEPKTVILPMTSAKLVNKEAMLELTNDGPSEASASQTLQLAHSIEVPPSDISPPSPATQFPTSTVEASGITVEAPLSAVLSLAPLPSHPTTDVVDLVDFHGLFEIDSRRALLLDEAFAKYPRLWEWRKGFRGPKYCKLGYECLGDMLVFLKSKTLKAMDEASKEEFEKLYAELESFGFDRGWLASINRKVTDAQAQNEKLKELFGRLENSIEVLNDVRNNMIRIKENLVEDDTVFEF